MDLRSGARTNKGKPPEKPTIDSPTPLGRLNMADGQSSDQTKKSSTSGAVNQSHADKTSTASTSINPPRTSQDNVSILIQQVLKMNENMLIMQREMREDRLERMELERQRIAQNQAIINQQQQPVIVQPTPSETDADLKEIINAQSAIIDTMKKQLERMERQMSVATIPTCLDNNVYTNDESQNDLFNPNNSRNSMPPEWNVPPGPASLTHHRESGQSAFVGHKRLNDLPVFSGRTEEWVMFHAAFRNSTEAYGYNSMDNAFRLQKALTGKAREAVSNLLNSGRDVETAMDTLQMMFGQPVMLIQCEIEKASAIPPIKADQLEQWAPFAGKVRNLVAVLDTDSTQQHLCNPVLLDKLLQKLPAPDRLLWSDETEHLQTVPTLKHFSDWVTKMAKRASRVVTTQPFDDSAGSSHRRSQMCDRRSGKSNVLLLTNKKSNENVSFVAKCIVCAGTHTITKCEAFQKMNVADRWSEVKRRRVCFCCLKGGHSATVCRKKVICDIEGCKRKHHQLLHDSNFVRIDEPVATTSSENPLSSTSASNVNIAPLMLSFPPPVVNTSLPRAEPKLLMRIIPVKLYGPNKTISTFALFDDAAKVTLMDEAMANQLNLRGELSPLNLSWYGGKASTEPSSRVNLHISGIGENAERYAMGDVRTVHNLQLPKQTIALSELHSKYHHLKNLPISDLNNAMPKILIGLGHCNLGMPRQTVNGDEGFVAIRTKLGWMLYGQQRYNETNPESTKRNELLLINDNSPENSSLDELHDIVRDFHTTESFGVRGFSNPLLSRADERAMKILQETTVRKGDHFETGLLWATDNVQLPKSRVMAENRLAGVERKMRKNEKFANLYVKNIEKYIKKGYAWKMSAIEAAHETPRTWYLPHFGVENVNKPNKVRLVFDAAATVNGVSLNTALLTGPDVYTSLPKILFQFRINVVGVCGDIEEMFHRITIRQEDQDSQRFLWRDGDSSKEIETYVMQAMTFGARCSPCSAQFV